VTVATSPFVPENTCVTFEVLSFNLARSTCHMHCSACVYGQKSYCACAVSRDLGVGGNKKAQLSLTNPRKACEKFARFT